MFESRTLPRTLDAALRDAGHASESVRRAALADLVRLAREGEGLATHAVLRLMADDPVPALRAEAALGLADAGATDQLDALRSRLNDPSPPVRAMVLLALGELAPGPSPGLSVAVQIALGDEDPRVRFQALTAASRLELPDAAAARARALLDGDPEVRFLAIRLSAARGDVFERADSERLLRDSDPRVCVAAAMSVADAEDASEARAVLASALNRGLLLPDPADTQELIELVGELGIREAIPGLRRQAYGRFGLGGGAFAWQAEISLARLGDERAVAALTKGLSSRSRTRRTLAALGCARAGMTAERGRVVALGASGQLDAEVVTTALSAFDAV